MLPAYGDCARRTAARQWPRLLAVKGYELRRLLPTVAAPIGTAVHHAAAMILRTAGYGEANIVEPAVQAAIDGFNGEIAPGAEWDTTSPNIGVAHQQITRMVQSLLPLLRTMRPTIIETQMRATISAGWELTGHPDVIETAGLTDWKTGAVMRPPHAQLGAYGLLAESNGHPIDTMRQVYVPRVAAKKPQPAPTIQAYDADDCERAAEAAVEQIIHDVERFDRTGDPFSFSANPMSMMCTPKYCPCWGTSFCTLHLPAKPTTTEEMK